MGPTVRRERLSCPARAGAASRDRMGPGWRRAGGICTRRRRRVGCARGDLRRRTLPPAAGSGPQPCDRHAPVTLGEAFDGVFCHGVVIYVEVVDPFVAALAALAAPGGAVQSEEEGRVGKEGGNSVE